MEKGQKENTKSSRMVGYLAAAVALLTVAFIVLITCSTYLIENRECAESKPNALAPMSDAGNCESFHYDGQFGNTTYSEHTTVCESTKIEFGIIRDKHTGFIINIFFADFVEEVEMVYLAKSHQCLLTNDMGNDDFYDDLENYRNENYDRGVYAYSVGNRVRSWKAIPENMRGYCSPQNTFEWLKQEPDMPDDSDDHRQKRQSNYMWCCFFIYGGFKYGTWSCGPYDPVKEYSLFFCVYDVYSAWSNCPPIDPLTECLNAFCDNNPVGSCLNLLNWIVSK